MQRRYLSARHSRAITRLRCSDLIPVIEGFELPDVYRTQPNAHRTRFSNAEQREFSISRATRQREI